jgi:hypothetical protein
MPSSTDRLVPNQTTTRTNYSRLYVSLELRRSTWLATSFTEVGGKMSKHFVTACDSLVPS